MGDLVLYQVPARHVDFAWNDGAESLKESCEEECTIDQLKMLIARGERQLVRMDRDGKPVGWGCYRIDSLPNMRVLHATNLCARNANFEEFFDLLKGVARDAGCSKIRCAAKPVQARIYAHKLGFEPVYTTLQAGV